MVYEYFKNVKEHDSGALFFLFKSHSKYGDIDYLANSLAIPFPTLAESSGLLLHDITLAQTIFDYNTPRGNFL